MSKSKDFKDRLLVELWKAQKIEGLTRYLDAKTVADTAGLQYAAGQLRLCMTEFDSHGYIKKAFTMEGGGPDGGLGFSMTQRGIETAEEIEEDLVTKSDSHSIVEAGDSMSATGFVLNPEIPPQASTAPQSTGTTSFGYGSDRANYNNGNFAASSGRDIPATNRYVSAQDNQQAIIEIRESVAELIEAVREDRTNDFDDKEGRLGEILAFDLLLQQPQISVPAVELILRDTVQYLAGKFRDVAIGQIALHLIKLAASAFGIHL